MTVKDCFARVGRNLWIVNISTTGQCNIECSMCAYRYYRKHGEMSMDVFRSAVAQMKKYVDEQSKTDLILSYTGGEPTINIGLLAEMVEHSRSVLGSRATQILVSNGAWGKDPEKIKQINDIHFDAMQLSCSASHHEMVGEEPILNILKGIDTAEVWCSFIGGAESLYAKAFETVKECNRIFYELRLPPQPATFIAGAKHLYHASACGVNVQPDGCISPVCQGEGSPCECVVGYLKSDNGLTKALHALTDTQTEFVAHNCEVSSPICHHFKRAGSVGCFTHKLVEAMSDSDGNLTIFNEVKRNG